MMKLTIHAIERFIKHWRPGMTFAEAEQTLRKLVACAARTRRNTLPGDARVYVVHTERGERICLAVRERVVVTVLDRHVSERTAFGCGLSWAGVRGEEGYAEHLADRHATIIAGLLADRTAARREKAESIVAAWRAGQQVKSKTLRRAADLLGLSEEQLAHVPTAKQAA